MTHNPARNAVVTRRSVLAGMAAALGLPAARALAYPVLLDPVAQPGLIRVEAPALVRPSTGLRTLEAFGAKGDGRSDDDAAFARAVSYMAEAHTPVALTGGRRYVVNSRVAIPDGGGLVGAGGASLFAPASSFDNRLLTPAGRYGANAVVLDLSGSLHDPSQPCQAPLLRGFRIEAERRTGRCVSAVVARNVRDLRIEGLDISGFPVGCGIKAATLSGRSGITRNHVHDFYDDTVWPDLPQITGIELDNDVVEHTRSSGVSIVGNLIERIVVSGAFLHAHGYQTDGINALHSDACAITGNRITTVGEGIDCSTSGCRIEANIVSDAFIFGLKLVHGATANTLTSNRVRGAGLAGITLAGSPNPANPDCSRNAVMSNTVEGIDPSGAWRSHTSACVLIQDNGGVTSRPLNNTITDNRLDPGTGGRYVIASLSTGTNLFAANEAVRPGRDGLSNSPRIASEAFSPAPQ